MKIKPNLTKRQLKSLLIETFLFQTNKDRFLRVEEVYLNSGRLLQPKYHRYFKSKDYDN